VIALPLFDDAPGGYQNFGVAGTAANIRTEGEVKCFVIGCWVGLEQCRKPHRDAGGAVATLSADGFMEGGLDNMEFVVSSKALDGLDIAAINQSSKADTGELWAIVDDDGAGTTIPRIAPVLGACEAEVLA